MAVQHIAIDIGGTFTDVVLVADNGDINSSKTLSTHHNLLEGVESGISQVLEAAGAVPGDVNGLVVHATTVVTNALIERKGARTALVTTHGFRDVLHLRNEWRYDMFDLQLEFPRAIVPPEDTWGVRERTYSDGTIAEPANESDLEVLVADLRERGITTVAVCLLNSYANPANEQAVGRYLNEHFGAAFVSLSSDVSPQIREYVRASTTTINAYAVPVTKPYLESLSAALEHKGFPNKPIIMLSNGGLVGSGTAGTFPVRMIESGPAAGALATSFYARLLGLDRIMGFDMGGTTAKACLVEDGAVMVTGTFEVDRKYRLKAGSGLPISVPSVDLIEIGAGGGSVASVNELGLLKVGPESAGSLPGPACYGRGGSRATVTDANLLLGLLDAESFLGGEMRLDRMASEACVGALGASLGMSVAECAKGIYEVVSEAMALAARAHATERGSDARGMPLFAFGGGGPLHACQMGELLDSSTVIFPPHASVLSAFGTLVTPPRLDLVRSMIGKINALDWAMVDASIGDMQDKALDALIEAGCPRERITIEIAADMRYRGQQHELTVTLAEDPRIARSEIALRAAFEQAYEAQYRITLAQLDVELVNWRLAAIGPAPELPGLAMADRPISKPRSRRHIALWGTETDVWHRDDIAPGQRIVGPALIEERQTTAAILPGWCAVVHQSGCIIASRVQNS